MDQRTRTLLPALPALVKAVERQLKDAQTCLATGPESPAGAPFTTPAGETLLRRAGVSSRVYADDPATGRRRDLTVEEERAPYGPGPSSRPFVTLACASRKHSNSPTTASSPTSCPPQARSCPCSRSPRPSSTRSGCCWSHQSSARFSLRSFIASGAGSRPCPWSSTYDSLERLWSAPMPFLFQRRCGPEDRAIPRNYIYTLPQRRPRRERADLARQRAAAIHAPRLPKNLRDRRPPLRPAPAHRRPHLWPPDGRHDPRLCRDLSR